MPKLSKAALNKMGEGVKAVLDKVLLPYQQKYLLDNSRYILWEKSRRVGVTWTCALKSVIKRVRRTKPLDHLFSSADMTAAGEWLMYCRDWSEKINTLLDEEVVPLDQWTKEVGYFSNGSRLMLLSSNAKMFRSKQGDVTIDEYAHHEQQDEIYKAAQPCILWHGDAQLELISSHNGPETQFNILCRKAEYEPKKQRFSWYRVTLHDAVKSGLALKVWKDRISEFPDRDALDQAFIDEIRSGCATDEDYEQEYNCCPAKQSALIDPETYDKLILRDRETFDPRPVPEELRMDREYGELFVGIDCGRREDLTVVWVLERGYDHKAATHLRDVYRPVCVRWMRNTPFPAQEQVIRSIVNHPMVSKGYIDMGAVGRGLADSVQDITGSVVEGIGFSAPKMAEMAERVRAFVQQNRLAMHPDNYVRQDILCVRKTQTKGGSWTYGGSTRTTHGDFFWAMALALHAASACGAARVALATGSELMAVN